MYIIIGFVIFFIIEKALHWHHCHNEKCDIHSFAYMILIGDAVHNFLDGLIIAASFVASTTVGLTTTLAIIFHEIPQELGDFGALVHGGFKKNKALLANFISAVTAVLGGLIGYYFSTAGNSLIFLLPFAAGGFIYIAASDLIPEIRKETEAKKIIWNLILFLIGIISMYLLLFFK